MISENKKKIVIENYFKEECDINTSIKDAYVKGFERGIQKAMQIKDHWIPVKEKMPKKDGSYLVSGKWASGKEAVGDCEYSRHD